MLSNREMIAKRILQIAMHSVVSLASASALVLFVWILVQMGTPWVASDKYWYSLFRGIYIAFVLMSIVILMYSVPALWRRIRTARGSTTSSG